MWPIKLSLFSIKISVYRAVNLVDLSTICNQSLSERNCSCQVAKVAVFSDTRFWRHICWSCVRSNFFVVRQGNFSWKSGQDALTESQFDSPCRMGHIIATLHRQIHRVTGLGMHPTGIFRRRAVRADPCHFETKWSMLNVFHRTCWASRTPTVCTRLKFQCPIHFAVPRLCERHSNHRPNDKSSNSCWVILPSSISFICLWLELVSNRSVTPVYS